MRDVFISYAHGDNIPNPDITHEITQAIDHFLAVYDHIREDNATTNSDLFFVDRSDVRGGEPIPESLRVAIEECSIMLAFISPRYFQSPHCLQEWKIFNRAMIEEVEVRAPKLLIPIEVRPTNPKIIPEIDAQSKEWLAELVGPSARKYAVPSRALLARDSTELAESLRALDRQIQGHLLLRRGSSGERLSASNILALQHKILRDSLLTKDLQDELRERSGHLKYDRLDPVCVIFAGGTVGMIRQRNSDALHADYQMAATAGDLVEWVRQKLVTMPFNIHFFSLTTPVDSSNVTAQDWVNLANLIREQMGHYQGFVILHGTNTLAYTASALSFLLQDCISKPVVLTGAEVPISIPNTDATHNVENAIRAAAWQAYNGPIKIPEVAVFWNNHLFRGNRVTKKYASDRVEGFHSPNMPVPLAILANERLTVDHGSILFRSDASENSRSVLGRAVDMPDARVDVLFIHPGMNFDDLSHLDPRGLDGLILLSYGPGNVPEDPRFIEAIEELVRKGTIVCNVTQCPYGRVELKLFETSATLFDLGVIDAYDMTLEAAYTKLSFAIARLKNRRQAGVQASIRRTFQRNIAGEMSASISDTSFGGSGSFETLASLPYQVSDVGRLDQMVDRYDIAEAFMRLEGVRIPSNRSGCDVRLLYGRPTDRDKDMRSSINLLAEFHKEFNAAEMAVGVFDKNLEITPNFRKWYSNDEFQISIGMREVQDFEFSSLRLVVYTKGGSVE